MRQSTHFDDCARASGGCVAVEAAAKINELGGPQIYTYRELLELLRSRLGTRTLLIPLPFALWHGLAAVAEQLPRPPITRNQVELMRLANVLSGHYPGFAELEIGRASCRERVCQYG